MTFSSTKTPNSRFPTPKTFNPQSAKSRWRLGVGSWEFLLWQRVGQQLCAVVAAYRQDDELLAVDLIAHGRPGLPVRHFHRADVRPRGLVIGAQQRDAAAGVVGVHAAFTRNQQVLRRQHADEGPARLS